MPSLGVIAQLLCERMLDGHPLRLTRHVDFVGPRVEYVVNNIQRGRRWGPDQEWYLSIPFDRRSWRPEPQRWRYPRW